jgi:hypothetical protein
MEIMNFMPNVPEMEVTDNFGENLQLTVTIAGFLLGYRFLNL